MQILTSGRHSSRGTYWRVVGVATVVLAAFALAPSAAAIDGFEIVIPINTIVEAPEGSHTVLATEPVPEQYLGQSCAVLAETANNESTHPGNDLVVSSGGSSGTLPDVEAESVGTVHASGRVVLGSEVVVTLVMGPD